MRGLCPSTKERIDNMDAKFQIRLPKELYQKFKDISKSNAQTPSLLVRNWIEKYVEENNNYGTVEFEGKEYTLTQQPYIDGKTDDRPHYRAMAVDKEGNDHEVTWNVVDYWEIIEDESESCDWDEPESVEKI